MSDEIESRSVICAKKYFDEFFLDILFWCLVPNISPLLGSQIFVWQRSYIIYQMCFVRRKISSTAMKARNFFFIIKFQTFARI